MKKSYVFALGLSCLAVLAYHEASAQVGLGGGVVGTLGANGSASRFGGVGSGISTGTTLRGEDLRQTGQLSADTRGQTQLPATSGNATGGVNTDTTVKPSGVNTDVKAGGGASASAPVVSGSAWGSAESSTTAGASATTPDAKETVRDTKAAARNKADKLEQKRDKIEERGDKAVDKALQ